MRVLFTIPIVTFIFLLCSTVYILPKPAHAQDVPPSIPKEIPSTLPRHSKAYALEQRAMQCDVEAMYAVGMLYMQGQEGAPQDFIKAYAFVHLAGALGNRAVQEELLLISKKLTPEQKDLAEALISKLWKEIPKP